MLLVVVLVVVVVRHYWELLCIDFYLNNNLISDLRHNMLLFKKNLNASKPSEHPPQVEECLKV